MEAEPEIHLKLEISNRGICTPQVPSNKCLEMKQCCKQEGKLHNLSSMLQ